MTINTPKHKVFVSFHHADDDYRLEFENAFSNNVETFVSRSVKDGDIDQYIKTDTARRLIRDKFISDSTVTIVLIGKNTWRRKHVDWELGYSLKSTSQNTRSGLIGILLPNYEKCSNYRCEVKTTRDGTSYTPCNIPPRLYDNIRSGYAKIYSCPINANNLKSWIHEAFDNRKLINLDNSRTLFAKNREENQTHWQN